MLIEKRKEGTLKKKDYYQKKKNSSSYPFIPFFLTHPFFKKKSLFHLLFLKKRQIHRYDV